MNGGDVLHYILIFTVYGVMFVWLPMFWWALQFHEKYKVMFSRFETYMFFVGTQFMMTHRVIATWLEGWLFPTENVALAAAVLPTAVISILLMRMAYHSIQFLDDD